MRENRGLWTNPELVNHSFFSPEEIAQIKALASQLPAERGIPLSRFSITEIVREVISAAIVQKKALTPNDFPSHQMVEKRLLDFQIRYQEVARPFRWKFTRKDLKEKLKLVSDYVIKQYQPITSQESITEKLISCDEIQEPSSDYAYT